MAHLKTRQEMANEYGICVKTFIKKLADAGIVLPERELISLALQKDIYEKLGNPASSEQINLSSGVNRLKAFQSIPINYRGWQTMPIHFS